MDNRIEGTRRASRLPPIRDSLRGFSLGKAARFLIYLLLAWFVVACLILPNLNLLKLIFFPEGSFSVAPFRRLFRSAKAMKSLRNSFILGPTLSLTVGFVGVSLVLITEYFDIKGAKILRVGYMTTLVYGGIILVSGYKFIYGKSGYLTDLLSKVFPGMNTGWFTGFWAVLFVMTFACTSNHMLFLRNAIRSVDYQTIEAARNLGASQSRILTRVVLPTLAPPLFAVTILTFISGLSAFSAPLLVGGTEFQTITPMILAFSQMESSRDISCLLSLFLGFATLLLLFILTRIERKGTYISISKVKTKIVKQKIYNPVLNVLAHVYAYVLFLIYAAPVVLIALFSFMDSRTIALKKIDFKAFTLSNYTTILTQPESLRPLMISFVYSVLASVIVVLLVVVVCRILQKHKSSHLANGLEYAMMIPWLLPTTLIAMGLIMTFNVPKIYMFNTVLTGTMGILLLGYVIVSIPFTLRMTKASFFSLEDSLEDAAKSLGAHEVYTFVRVILPAILPTVLAVTALNFNGLLGDYDLSIFLYHPLHPTLGVFIKGLTEGQGNANGTALVFVYSVIMMAASAIVLYLVYGRNSKDESPTDLAN
jgi:iron(III) transport system permease protein